MNPEYEQFFSDPTKTEQFFRSMGNFLTPQQRSSIIEELENPVTRNQPDVSICLTNEERAAWDLARERAFADPELGRKFVDNELLAIDARALRNHIKSIQPDANLKFNYEDNRGRIKEINIPIGLGFFWPDVEL